MRKKRIGTVTIGIRYVVDVDNADMVNQAMDLLYDDLFQAIVKSGSREEFENMLAVVHNPDEGLTEADIDECLLEEEEEYEDEEAEYEDVE